MKSTITKILPIKFHKINGIPKPHHRMLQDATQLDALQKRTAISTVDMETEKIRKIAPR